MKPVTPIYVNARFLTQPLTGIQRSAYELAKRIESAVLVSPDVPRPEYRSIDRDRVLVAPSRLPHHLWEQVVLPSCLPKNALLWSPGGSGPVRVGERQVLTIHDLSVYDFPDGFSRSYRAVYKALYAVLPRRTRRITTVSQFSRRRIIELLRVPPQSVGVVSNAPAQHFRPLTQEAVRARLDTLSISHPYFLSLGAISARKNFRRLLEAWSRICRHWPDHWLVVVGKSGLAFSDDGSLGPLPARTLVLQDVTEDQLVALYNGADVMAYPSLYEGFGLPILEAMACGTPVLTSNVSALPEIAGGAAELVDPTSVDDIAARLDALLSDAGKRAMYRERGLARAAMFTWEAAAERLLAEFSS